MIASSENMDFVKQLADVITKPVWISHTPDVYHDSKLFTAQWNRY